MKTFKIGGVHPHDSKISAGKKIENVPIPKQAIFQMNQHIGAPAVPIVAKGDSIKVGQLIGKPGGFMSAAIHSSVSGSVKKIAVSKDAYGNDCPSIHIDVEGDEWLETIDRTDTIIKEIAIDAQEIIKRVADAGIVGLGGACFPTHIKLTPPPGSKAEVLIINAVECEPFLTCDHQLMLEHAEEIFIGIQLIMKAIKVEKCIIGIEENKPDAIKLFEKMAPSYTGISICSLKKQYPQGGEKQLIDATIGKQVPSGALPIATGAVVQNVATVYAVYEAVQKHKPLIGRVMTLTGKSVKNPGNYFLRFGTPLTDVIELAGGLPEDTGKVIAGGPMMGRAIKLLDHPATKRSSGMLVMPTLESQRKEMENCIRCGKCVSACPMGLEPYLLVRQAERKMWDEMQENHIMDCIECGCCLYSCPSNRPLLDYVRLGKQTVGGILRAKAAANKK